ncbi:MAG: isochorismate synthase [Myxococcales bacterium]|nr:isochorismate synthase [Myxococcales bacterium]
MSSPGLSPLAPNEVVDPRGSLEQRIAGALERSHGCALVSLSVPAPRVPADTLLRARGDAPSFLWAPPAATHFAGFGAAQEISSAGPGRFRESAQRGAQVLREIRELLAPEAPNARLFGGFAFQSASGEHGLSDPWQSFGEARFLLPRVRYAVSGDQAWLSLTLGPSERNPERVAEELHQLLGGLRHAEAPNSLAMRQAHGDVVSTEASSYDSWQTLIQSILAAIAKGGAEKIVAARKTRFTLQNAVDPLAVLQRLQGSPNVNRVAFRFAMAEFLAATPERLLRRSGRQIQTEALAGTLPTQRASGSVADAVRALLASRKDREEHAYVVQEILRCLAPFCSSIRAADEPVVRELRHVVHLQTPIAGELAAEPERHVLELVEALHPTPAVGGVPREFALDFLSQHEALERGWYAGPLGWFDAAGDGEFWVGLRSGVFEGNQAHLFAGAGIVRGSETQSEFAETEVKLTSLLRALGIA